jgi:lipopolysaccharide biosynthesis glycosyltransferase
MFKRIFKKKSDALKRLIGVVLASAVSFGNLRQDARANRENPIPIVIALDDNYLYPAIVSMSSMLQSANEGTFYKIYAMVPGTFKEENKIKLGSLQEKYENCEMEFIDMGSEFQKYQVTETFPATAFYRLAIPKILYGKHDKCIYLDVDTLVTKDLTSFYQYDLGSNYIGGVKNMGICSSRKPNWRSGFEAGVNHLDQYINSGVILWNIAACHNDSIYDKFIKFYETFKGKANSDQNGINEVCYNKILHLPLMYNFGVHWKHSPYNQNSIAQSLYSESEYEQATHDPTIIHYASKNKPWRSLTCLFNELWWQAAFHTPFWPEIREKYFNALSRQDQASVRRLAPEAFGSHHQAMPVQRPTTLSQMPTQQRTLPPALTATITDSAPFRPTQANSREWWRAAHSSPEWDSIRREYMPKLTIKERVQVWRFLREV